jgi:hypothetical protein
MSQRGTHSRDPLAHPGDEVATLLANGSVAVYDPTDKTAMKVGGWE